MLAEAMEHCKLVEEVSFTSNDLSMPSGERLLKSLSVMENLQKVNFNSCQLNEQLIYVLCKALEHNTTLMDLNLYNNEIKPDGCKMIADMLKNKSNMKVLGLS